MAHELRSIMSVRRIIAAAPAPQTPPRTDTAKRILQLGAPAASEAARAIRSAIEVR